MQSGLIGFLFWFWEQPLFVSLCEFWVLSLQNVLVFLSLALDGSLTCQCWRVTRSALGWASVDLFLSLSPAVHSVLLSLWALATLTSLDSQLRFLHLGGPQVLPGFLLPGPRPGGSQGSKLGQCVACVVCFLSPGITVFHCLSKIFSTVVSYVMLDFYYFMQKAESVWSLSFHLDWKWW